MSYLQAHYCAAFAHSVPAYTRHAVSLLSNSFILLWHRCRLAKLASYSRCPPSFPQQHIYCLSPSISRCKSYRLPPRDGFSLSVVPAGCNPVSFPASHEVRPCHQSFRWFRSALHHRCGQQTALCPNCILLLSVSFFILNCMTIAELNFLVFFL